jgi:RP/EB family microtubule-associated protein
VTSNSSGSISHSQQIPVATITGGAAKRAPVPLGNDSSAVAARKTCIATSDQATAELRAEVTQLKVLIDKIEKERDFYFGKLRSVEVFCQQNEEEPNLKQILELLYSE